MKDAFWFQHDSNARNDVRILELRAELGWEGYGLWWALVEQLRESTDYRLSNDKMGGLAMGMGIPKKQLESLLALCFDLGLLDLEDGYFLAPALCRRMEAWDTKRAALAEAGKRGAARRWAGDKPADAEPMPSHKPSDSHPNGHPIDHPNATPIAIREENIRGEKITEEPLPSVEDAASATGEPQKKIDDVADIVVGDITPESSTTELRTPGGAAPALTSTRGGKWQAPELAEVVAYFTEKRPRNPGCWQTEAERFVDYYTSNGWKVGRTAMQDWRAAVRNWLKKVPEVGPAYVAPVVASGYNGAIGNRPSQVSTRAAAIAGADAMFDALAAGQDPLANRYP